MPEATKELRDRILKQFGSLDDDNCIRYLKSRGYILNKGYVWRLPSKGHQLTSLEEDCIQFLIEEWDFGGYVEDEKETDEKVSTC